MFCITNKSAEVENMKILVFGAGVLGCNLAVNLLRAGKDVSLLARGKWKDTIKTKGLMMQNEILHTKRLHKIPVIEQLGKQEHYDAVFVCLRYNQVLSAIETLKENISTNIIFIGNNLNCEEIANRFKGKNIMFGFTLAAGRRTESSVISIDLRTIYIGEIKGGTSNEPFIREMFKGTKYKVKYEANMADFLLCHAAIVLPLCHACYAAEGDLKKVSRNKAYIRRLVKANVEALEALEALGHEILPKGIKKYKKPWFQNSMYLFYRFMSASRFGKLCAADHAMNAQDEMGLLCKEFETFVQKSPTGRENHNFICTVRNGHD